MMFCQKNKDSKDRGAVLLTALLIMTLMSALAVAIMNDVRMTLLRSGNIEAHAQTEWHLKAAEDFAIGYLEKEFIPLKAIEKNIALRQPIETALEIDGGVMQLKISDGTQCLPLSAMVPPIETDDFGNVIDNNDDEELPLAAALTNLLVDIGLTELDAGNLTAAIVDWQDGDQQISDGGAEDYTYLIFEPPYRTANAPFHSIHELRSIRGMDEKLLKVLHPFICTGDEQREGAVNINTFRPEHLPLLAAILGPNEEDLAAQILQSRPPNGYSDMQAELESSGVDFARVDFSNFVYEPAYLWIEVDVIMENASRTVLLEFKIDSGGLTRTYRHYGTEGRRPTLDTEDKLLDRLGL